MMCAGMPARDRISNAAICAGSADIFDNWAPESGSRLWCAVDPTPPAPSGPFCPLDQCRTKEPFNVRRGQRYYFDRESTAECVRMAIERQSRNRVGGTRNMRFSHSLSDETANIIGVLGEYAFSRMHGLPVEIYDTACRGAATETRFDASFGNGMCVDVKTTSNQNIRSLMVPAHKMHNPPAFYALMVYVNSKINPDGSSCLSSFLQPPPKDGSPLSSRSCSSRVEAESPSPDKCVVRKRERADRLSVPTSVDPSFAARMGPPPSKGGVRIKGFENVHGQKHEKGASILSRDAVKLRDGQQNDARAHSFAVENAVAVVASPEDFPVMEFKGLISAKVLFHTKNQMTRSSHRANKPTTFYTWDAEQLYTYHEIVNLASADGHCL
jgi:hypothetical protein